MDRKPTNGPWKQGFYEISETATEIVGTKRENNLGEVFHYAKAGAVALVAGEITIPADMDTDVQNCAVAAAAAVGSTQVTLTITETTIVENYFSGGKLVINDAAGAGISYQVLYSPAVTAGTSITVTIEDPGVITALTTSSEGTLMQSPWMGTLISVADQADMCVGAPIVPVTASYYYWSKTRGDVPLLMDEAIAKGSEVTIGSSTVGAVEAVDAAAEPSIGVMRELGVDTEYCTVFLTID